MIITRRYLRYPMVGTYVNIEILGEKYFYAKATFRYIPYQTEGTHMDEVIRSLITSIYLDNLSVD